MSEDLILKEKHGLVTVLSMNYRPYNLIGPTLTRPLLAAFRQAVEDGSRAIVLRSALRHFSAGADTNLFSSLIEAKSNTSSGPVDTLRAFETLPIPIVASLHGVVLGGGLEIALACDYIVAAQSAKLGSVEAALGMHPLMGGIQREAQRLGAARAKEMAMLGRRYDAATLERWGLINLVVPDEQLDSAALAVAQELANGPTVAHAATKKLVSIAINEGVEAADLAMAEVQKAIWASEDVKTGLTSFRANGPGLAKFEGR